MKQSSKFYSNISFLMIAIILLIWGAAIPPFQNPDEAAHYIKACSDPVVDKHNERGYGHYFDRSINTINKSANVQAIIRGEDKFSFREFYDEPVFKSDSKAFYRHALPNTFIPYLIPHINCKILEQFKISYQTIFYLLKISFIISFLFLIYLCKLADEKLFLSIVPLFAIPMVINQGAAISADYFSIGSAALLGVTIGMIVSGIKVGRWHLSLSIFLILNSKIVYAPLLLGLITPLIYQRKIFFTRAYFSPAFMSVFAGLTLQAYYQIRKTPLSGAHQNTLTQIERFKDDPLWGLQIIFDSMSSGIVHYIREFIGVAGWLTTPIPNNLMIAALSIIVIWLIFALTRTIQFSLKNSSIVLIAIIALFISIFLVFLSMLFYWTNSSKLLIEGVQGRYFIPLIFYITPIIFSLRDNSRIHIESMAPFVALMIVSLLFLTNTIIPHFHI
jgi:uncharacterized membrane protein